MAKLHRLGQSGGSHRREERGGVATAEPKVIDMLSPQQPNNPSLTAEQQHRADDAQEAITKALAKEIEKENAAGIDLTKEQIQAKLTEIVAEHLTDDEAVDEEILESTQDMRVLLGGLNSRSKPGPR